MQIALMCNRRKEVGQLARMNTLVVNHNAVYSFCIFDAPYVNKGGL